MSEYVVSASRSMPVPADVVYRGIGDFSGAHQRILPPAYRAVDTGEDRIARVSTAHAGGPGPSCASMACVRGGGCHLGSQT